MNNYENQVKYKGKLNNIVEALYSYTTIRLNNAVVYHITNHNNFLVEST